jgi:hypothetical protein
MNADIADALADHIHAAIALHKAWNGIATEPIVHALRIVDVIEAYGRQQIQYLCNCSLSTMTLTADSTTSNCATKKNDGEKENAMPASPKEKGAEVSPKKKKNPESFEYPAEYPSQEKIPSPDCLNPKNSLSSKPLGSECQWIDDEDNHIAESFEYSSQGIVEFPKVVEPRRVFDSVWN